MKVNWRYDYFLAFENLYDFYARTADDDAGFSANLPSALAGHVGLRAIARLVEPVISESATCWKAALRSAGRFHAEETVSGRPSRRNRFRRYHQRQVLCRILPGRSAAPPVIWTAGARRRRLAVQR